MGLRKLRAVGFLHSSPTYTKLLPDENLAILFSSFCHPLLIFLLSYAYLTLILRLPYGIDSKKTEGGFSQNALC